MRVLRSVCSFAICVCQFADLTRAEPPVFEDDQRPKLVLERGAGEGPAWHPKLGLLFSGGGHINRMQADGSLVVYRKGAGTNGLLLDSQKRVLACEPRFRRVTSMAADGTIEVLTSKYKGQPYNQPNDLTVDAQGRIYFSDPKYGPRTDMLQVDADGKKIEGVYRIDSDGKVTRIITHEVDRPNGVLVTANNQYLYVADNNNNDVGGARKLWRFNLKADGSLDYATQKLIFDWKKGRGPDGLVEDRAGLLYVAGGLNKPNPPAENTEFKGGVYVFEPQGKLVTVVHIPRDEVTNCSFGGVDLRTLYITAGGTLWSIRTKSIGSLPWARK